MKQIIPIFFTIDDAYAPFNAVAIKSLVENCSKDYDYKIIIIEQSVNEENKEKIKKLETENVKIEFHAMKKGLETITDREENKIRCEYFTLTIYFRLFIAEMFPEYDKAIYIDSDIIVPGDISELYYTNLEDNLIGASIDHSIQDVPELINYMENAIGIEKSKYINSGVLVLNLKKMREVKFSEKFLQLLNTFHFDSVCPDQDYLNAMCYGKITYLDPAWDVMPMKGEKKKNLENPKLIHYNLYDKPWCYDDVQYEDYFWNYAKKTNFYESIIEYKKNYSDERKKTDKKYFNILLKKANAMPDADVTFKKKFESGEDIRIL